MFFINHFISPLSAYLYCTKKGTYCQPYKSNDKQASSSCPLTLDKANTVLDFCEDAHSYFLNGNVEQKRRIVNIVCSNLIYKDKELDIELNSVFKTLVENAYWVKHGDESNRTLKKSTLTGFETDESANFVNGSPSWSRTSNLPVNSRLLRH